MYKKRIIFAGVAGVGKTTLAKTIAKILGMKYVSVEAKKCWSITNLSMRQKCFLEYFSRTIKNNYGVLDNSLLSVYVYSLVMNVEESRIFEEFITYEYLDSSTLIIVLTAEKDVIRRRIEERMTKEKDRATNPIERQIDIHIEADNYIREIAEKYYIPIINTGMKKKVNKIMDLL